MSSTFERRVTLIPTFPELDTERLQLRAFTDEDAPWYLEQFSRPETIDGQGYAPPAGIAGEALVWEHNDRSIHVLDRLGYVPVELLRDSFRDSTGALRNEWRYVLGRPS